MNINFIYPMVSGYNQIIDSIVDPILEHLPEGRKTDEPGPGLNVNFFTEPGMIKGCQAFIPHGIADKNYRTAPKVAPYSHVFVSGPAWRDLLIRQGLRADKILVGGYTKLDPIFNGKYKKKKKPIPVLWAPTHGAYDKGRELKTSSYPDFEQYLDKIKGVQAALHPAENEGHTPTMQMLVDAKVVIADYGSLVYEALALGKPVIIPDWLVKEGVMQYFHQSFECLMFEQNICYHARDIEHLLELVEVAKEQGIDAKTQNFIDAIFPPALRGDSGKVTAALLRGIKGIG